MDNLLWLIMMISNHQPDAYLIDMIYIYICVCMCLSEPAVSVCVYIYVYICVCVCMCVHFGLSICVEYIYK